MYITAPTLDDLLDDVFKKLLDIPQNVQATRGTMSELTGVLLCLENPRARLSLTETKGTPFSGIGELLWYLSRKNKLKFIEHYISAYKEESEDQKTVYGGYGPRLFNHSDEHNQVKNVIKLLKKRRSSRRAVIQLFEAKDIADPHKEIPCTCTMQFLVRNEKLDMIVYMRSNDAFLGLPHDIFCFTMLQEIIARSIGVELGLYKHCVGSLHLYQEKEQLARQYLGEGFQNTEVQMPAMPIGDPWSTIKKILKVEKSVRKGKKVHISEMPFDNYWKDISYLLQIYSLTKAKSFDLDFVKKIAGKISSEVYEPYIEKRLITSQKNK
jgi:thymidylate synthase